MEFEETVQGFEGIINIELTFVLLDELFTRKDFHQYLHKFGLTRIRDTFDQQGVLLLILFDEELGEQKLDHFRMTRSLNSADDFSDVLNRFIS